MTRQTEIGDLEGVEVPFVQEGLGPDAARVESVEQEHDAREWIAGCPIHPLASLLPLIEEEDLETLVEDIRAHGLRLPIVRNEAGEIIDGRNRLRACELAGVTPSFMELNGQDPLDYVASLNLERRHLNRSQRAMLTAWLRHLRKPCKDTKPEPISQAAERTNTSIDALNRCRIIINHAPQLAPEVISGRMTVSEAYDEARSIKAVKEGRTAMEERVRTGAPDLWQLVSDGSMPLPEAVRCLEAREREALAHALSLARNMSQGFRLLDPGSYEIEEQASHWLTVNPSLLNEEVDFSSGRARRIADALLRYAELREECDATTASNG